MGRKDRGQRPAPGSPADPRLRLSPNRRAGATRRLSRHDGAARRERERRSRARRGALWRRYGSTRTRKRRTFTKVGRRVTGI